MCITLINEAVLLTLPEVLFLISWSGKKLTKAAPRYLKHDSWCPYTQLTTHSSGQAEKAAPFFQIEMRNQLTTWNSWGKENKDEEERNNTNKQSNNCSHSDMEDNIITVGGVFIAVLILVSGNTVDEWWVIDWNITGLFIRAHWSRQNYSTSHCVCLCLHFLFIYQVMKIIL